jgi:CheY-like chemotaxis protein
MLVAETVPAANPPQMRTGKMTRFLLVEDSSRLQVLLGESLRGADYPLDVVGTVAEARAAMADVNYDLLIVGLGQRGRSPGKPG